MRRIIEIGLALVSLVACITWGVIWVRSWRLAEIVHAQAGSTSVEIISVEGRVKITHLARPFRPGRDIGLRSYSSDSSEATTMVRHLRGFANSKGFGYDRGENVAVLFPYWFPTVVFAFLALVFGFQRARRFRLRSLLIATALFAVVLWMMTCP